MRLRFAMLCAAMSTLALVAMPGIAGAAPSHNHGLTINATPNPIQAGEGVLIYGQLKGGDVVGKTVVLYHHINGSHQGFTVIGHTTTNSYGFYEFTREEGIVMINRQWFVRLVGSPSVHSRTVYEKVAALVSLTASSSTADTRHPITFTGHVTPSHGGQRMLLQEQGVGDDWRTLKVGRLGPDSNYSVAYAWRIPGEHVVRVGFPADHDRDGRNLPGVSDPVTVTIHQTQVSGFTLNSTTPVISYGHSARITGMLGKQDTSIPQPPTAITLCHRTRLMASPVCEVAGVTGNNGSYHFNVTPAENAWYFVRTTLKPTVRTANLFIGVKDVIALSVQSLTGTRGHAGLFSGTVTPNKAGDVVYLQRKDNREDYHTVAVTHVGSDSTYTFTHVFGTSGTKTFRARILADRTNLGDISQAVTVTVSPSPLATLHSAS